jgi:hypothetical protein
MNVETFILWVEHAQSIWDIVTKTPILYSLVHFIVSALVSILAFKLFDGGLGSSQQYQTLKKLLALKGRLSQPSSDLDKIKRAFSNNECGRWFSYAIITGATSASIIEVQFPGGAQVPWAVLYGLLGPYALRDILLSFLGKQQESETKIVTSNISDKKERASEDKEYLQSLGRTIKVDIYKKLREEAYEGIAADEVGDLNRIYDLLSQFMEGADDGE